MGSNAARAVLAVALVAIAAVGFVVLRDRGGDEESGTPTPAAPRSGPTDRAGSAIPTIVVRGGEPVGGVRELSTTSDESIRFRVRSLQPGEIHVHGYEMEKPVGPGRVASFDFPAELEGGFEVELHRGGGEVTIAEIEVRPG